MIDPDRRPTAFQWRVLNLVRAKGPIAIAGLQPHFQQHGNEAIRSACWILRCGGYLTFAAGQVDVTAAGRQVLSLEQQVADLAFEQLRPRRSLLQRMFGRAGSAGAR